MVCARKIKTSTRRREEEMRVVDARLRSWFDPKGKLRPDEELDGLLVVPQEERWIKTFPYPDILYPPTYLPNREGVGVEKSYEGGIYPGKEPPKWDRAGGADYHPDYVAAGSFGAGGEREGCTWD